MNKTKVNYMIIGGLAVIKWGRPRLTQDIDIIIQINNMEIESFAKILSSEKFEVQASEIQQALKENSHISIFFPDDILRIDLKGIYSHLDQRSFINRKKTIIFGVNTWIEAPEDLIIAKLVYNSYQDLEDAISVILRQTDKLNYEYLNIRAKEENLIEALNDLLNKTKKI